MQATGRRTFGTHTSDSPRPTSSPWLGSFRLAWYVATGQFLAGAIIIALAFGKALDLSTFAETIERIGYAASGSRATFPLAGAATVIIVLEAGLGTALLLNIATRLIACVAFGILGFFTVVLCWMVIARVGPACGCSGAFSSLIPVIDTPAVALIRNVVMMWIMVAVWLGIRPSRESSVPA